MRSNVVCHGRHLCAPPMNILIRRRAPPVVFQGLPRGREQNGVGSSDPLVAIDGKAIPESRVRISKDAMFASSRDDENEVRHEEIIFHARWLASARTMRRFVGCLFFCKHYRSITRPATNGVWDPSPSVSEWSLQSVTRLQEQPEKMRTVFSTETTVIIQCK